MFSENHHKILQEVAVEFSTVQTLADKVGLPAALTTHLLQELSQDKFIDTVRAFRFDEFSQLEIVDVVIRDKGKAAIESPEYFLEKMMATDKSNIWYGDKVAGDKVMGNKVQTGAVQGDAIAGNKIIHSQNLTQVAQDIKALLDRLAVDHPHEGEFVHARRAIEAIRSNPSLKQRLINAAKESGTTAVEKAIEAIVDNHSVSIVVAGIKGFIEAEG